MSYLQFHILFILPPIVLLALTWPGKDLFPARYGGRRTGLLGLALMALVALAYTTPWDNYLVYRGIWDYGEDRVTAVIGYVPLEEYLFFVLQPLLAGLWLYRLLPCGEEPLPDRPPPRETHLVGASFWIAVCLAGALMLWSGGEGLYLGLILAWAGPVLALQWAYDGASIRRMRRAWFLGVAVPSLYLWAVDRLAISLGIWNISGEHTTGLDLLGLPLEEAVFFLLTNLMVVQGLLLFLALVERLRTPGSRDVPKSRRRRRQDSEGARPLLALAREDAEVVYQFERPFVVDDGKYGRAFGGGEATPSREGIRQAIEWYRRKEARKGRA